MISSKFSDQMQSWERTFNLKFDSVTKELSRILVRLQECSKVRSQVLQLIELTNNMPINKVVDELRYTIQETDDRLSKAVSKKVDSELFKHLEAQVKTQD